MKLEEVIIKRIFDLCDERCIVPNKLAAMAGLSSTTIRCIFYGKSKNSGTRTILYLCKAIDISLFDFFNDSLFKNVNLEGSY